MRVTHCKRMSRTLQREKQGLCVHRGFSSDKSRRVQCFGMAISQMPTSSILWARHAE